MNQQEEFDMLFSCLKIIDEDKLNFPEVGSQNYHNLYKYQNKEEKFKLLINRKGHLNKQNLTYIMNSQRLKGLLVRLDMTGPPHIGIDGKKIDTPHVHIFDKNHNFGSIVEPLSRISNIIIKNELRDSLEAFLVYNNVDLKNKNIHHL